MSFVAGAITGTIGLDETPAVRAINRLERVALDLKRTVEKDAVPTMKVDTRRYTDGVAASEKAIKDLGVTHENTVRKMEQANARLAKTAKIDAMPASVGGKAVAAVAEEVTGGTYRDSLKEIKSQFGKGSALGQTLKLAAGGGAIAALSMGAHELEDITGKVLDLQKAWKDSSVTTDEWCVKLARSIPIFASLYNSVANVREAITGAAAANEKLNEEARQLGHIGDMQVQRLKDQAVYLVDIKDKVKAVREEMELAALTGFPKNIKLETIRNEAAQKATGEAETAAREKITGKYMNDGVDPAGQKVKGIKTLQEEMKALEKNWEFLGIEKDGPYKGKKHFRRATEEDAKAWGALDEQVAVMQKEMVRELAAQDKAAMALRVANYAQHEENMTVISKENSEARFKFAKERSEDYYRSLTEQEKARRAAAGDENALQIQAVNEKFAGKASERKAATDEHLNALGESPYSNYAKGRRAADEVYFKQLDAQRKEEIKVIEDGVKRRVEALDSEIKARKLEQTGDVVGAAIIREAQVFRAESFGKTVAEMVKLEQLHGMKVEDIKKTNQSQGEQLFAPAKQMHFDQIVPSRGVMIEQQIRDDLRGNAPKDEISATAKFKDQIGGAGDAAKAILERIAGFMEKLVDNTDPKNIQNIEVQNVSLPG